MKADKEICKSYEKAEGRGVRKTPVFKGILKITLKASTPALDAHCYRVLQSFRTAAVFNHAVWNNNKNTAFRILLVVCLHLCMQSELIKELKILSGNKQEKLL